MRQALLNYLTSALTGTIKTSNELPFEQGGSALYIKNMRKVYLDEPEVEQTQLLTTFDEDVNQNITTVRGYLAVDAKNRNIDLDSALLTLALARTQADISSSFRKEFDYTTTIDDDKIIYDFEYRFYTLA
jgi:hypothetical protein